ncbi:hypothetical protein QPL79_02215 [Ignisphaera sp. 4213-co]|uniref:DUF2299 domain-containing protein n=1 Tax=Ignisphaera cupida TaxID=3050454 RepID=A0ABD4Z4Y5_9CREN|nr:hypothetical protein [Ignisphaera sp. 4213-co]MDK6028179.1 hypothetical protein [Ignisphaera sp. 4213-co]
MEEELIYQGEGSEWIEKVKELLKQIGVRFEAEESVRIHRDDVVIEVVEREGRFTISINMEIPKTVELSELEKHASAYKSFLEIIAKSSAEPFYELDASIGYTFLRALINVDNIEKLLDMLRKIL